MLTGDQALTDFIRRTIRQRGPVTFAWFMEQALYHPELGYYSSGRCAIGRRGDYFTNVSVGPLFGRLLAAQFAEMWEVARPARKISPSSNRERIMAISPGMFSERCASGLRIFLRRFVIGSSSRFPSCGSGRVEALRDFGGKVTWEKSLDDLEPFCGVHFSNELLDAMPVHLISQRTRTPADWQERRVAESDDGFAFVTGANHRCGTAPAARDDSRPI